MSTILSETRGLHRLKSRLSVEAKMPRPEIYEREYDCWPWGMLLAEASDLVVASCSHSAFVVDYMCGTGFLLNKIVSKRSDLSALGCDISKPYTEYARTKYRNVTFVRADAREYEPPQRPDFVICTAGLHHLERYDQSGFIEKVSRDLPSDGFFLLGEEVIRDYRNESERKRALLEMFSELMCYLDKMNTPEAVVEAAADMLVNEWCARGEYKTSRSELEGMLRPFFKIVTVRQIWPDKGAHFGDWLFLCQRK